jgi:hypothetical protein
MNERQLRSNLPADAPEILAALIPRMQSAGLTVGEVGVLLESIHTVRQTAKDYAALKEAEAAKP